MTLNESQKGLSGIEKHARLSITHYKGKTEVNAVTNEPIPGLAGAENGVVIFKLLRNARSAPDRGKVCIVGRNPEALWFDDYEDRVLFDEAGLFDYDAFDETGEAPTCASRLPYHRQVHVDDRQAGAQRGRGGRGHSRRRSSHDRRVRRGGQPLSS
jgi:hypothetical protein